jgi:hypothetical protein
MPQDMNLSEICTLIFVFQIFSPANVVFAEVSVLSVCILLNSFVRVNHSDTVRADQKSDVTPLYLAALRGFQDLVGHLVGKYPQHVNTSGGYYVTPLVAELAKSHFRTAMFLYHNGAHVNIRGRRKETPLSSAVWCGDLEIVQVLLDYKVDVNAWGLYN